MELNEVYSQEDPNDPVVLVQGVGKYRLSTLKRNVLAKFDEMIALRRSLEQDDPDGWRRLSAYWNHSAAQEMVKTIAATQDRS